MKDVSGLTDKSSRENLHRKTFHKRALKRKKVLIESSGTNISRLR